MTNKTNHTNRDIVNATVGRHYADAAKLLGMSPRSLSRRFSEMPEQMRRIVLANRPARAAPVRDARKATKDARKATKSNAAASLRDRDRAKLAIVRAMVESGCDWADIAAKFVTDTVEIRNYGKNNLIKLNEQGRVRASARSHTSVGGSMYNEWGMAPMQPPCSGSADRLVTLIAEGQATARPLLSASIEPTKGEADEV